MESPLPTTCSSLQDPRASISFIFSPPGSGALTQQYPRLQTGAPVPRLWAEGGTPTRASSEAVFAAGVLGGARIQTQASVTLWWFSKVGLFPQARNIHQDLGNPDQANYLSALTELVPLSPAVPIFKATRGPFLRKPPS